MNNDVLNTWQLANELQKKYNCPIQTNDLKNIINFAKTNKHCGLIEQTQGNDCDYLFKKELADTITLELITFLRKLETKKQERT